jgi:hypothetical protein
MMLLAGEREPPLRKTVDDKLIPKQIKLQHQTNYKFWNQTNPESGRFLSEREWAGKTRIQKQKPPEG